MAPRLPTIVEREQRVNRDEFAALFIYGPHTVNVTGSHTLDTSGAGIGILSPLPAEPGEEFAVEFADRSRQEYLTVYCHRTPQGEYRIGGRLIKRKQDKSS
jgi:hypothetical protein